MLCCCELVWCVVVGCRFVVVVFVCCWFDGDCVGDDGNGDGGGDGDVDLCMYACVGLMLVLVVLCCGLFP